jgi:hypothetical protein
MGGKRQPEERVRSLAEIRGRYGLGEEQFQALAEGDRDRRVGTVVGRQRRAAARKFVPTGQAVMGTARLEAPPSVQERKRRDSVTIPVHPMRWWPLLAGALLTPVILVVISLSGSETISPARSTSAPVTPRVPHTALPERPTEQARALPAVPKDEVHSAPARRGIMRSEPPEAATSASSSAAPVRQNNLPDFPDLEEP